MNAPHDPQLQLDFSRASKLRTLERVECPGPVKALLKALDGFARDSNETEQTMRAIGISMGVSPSTARRAIRASELLGILQVFGDPKDGSKNRYVINWAAVFELPDAMTKHKDKRVRQRSLTPRNPSQSDRGTPPKMTGVPLPICEGYPFQVDRGPLPNWEGTPTKLTGVLAPVLSSDSLSADDVTASTAIETRDGGGGNLNTTPDEARPRRVRIPGNWCGSITKSSLTDPSARGELLRDAIKAGWLQNNNVDKVRLGALLLQASRTPLTSPGGFVVSFIESGSWHRLNEKNVSDVLLRLSAQGISLTDEERLQVRQQEVLR